MINNVLITSAGRRVSLVQSFMIELKKYDSVNFVFASDQFPELSAACRVADRFFKTVSLQDKNYVPELLQLCLDHHVKLVIPTIDTELLVLAKNREQFKENGIV